MPMVKPVFITVGLKIITFFLFATMDGLKIWVLGSFGLIYIYIY